MTTTPTAFHTRVFRAPHVCKRLFTRGPPGPLFGPFPGRSRRTFPGLARGIEVATLNRRLGLGDPMSRCFALIAFTSMLLPGVAYAQEGCPEGDWFCEPAEPAAEPAEAGAAEPAPEAAPPPPPAPAKTQKPVPV